MKNQKRNNIKSYTRFYLSLVVVCASYGLLHSILLYSAPPLVHEAEKKEPAQPLCGLMESFSGDVQVLDANRNQSTLLSLKTPLPCGSWIAANEGWVQIRHASSLMLHLGKNTLVQLLAIGTDPKAENDHLILYKGHVYLQGSAGQQEFRLVTATGRVRVARGKVLVNFSAAVDLTQLIGLQDLATLENRFESAHKIQVHEGQMTELDLSLQRVIPILPKGVSLAELAPQMDELKISFSDRALGEKAAAARSLASSEAHETAEHSEHAEPPVARAKAPALVLRQAESYQKSPPLEKDSSLQQHWAKKLGGGVAASIKILNPTHEQTKIKRNIASVQAVERKFLKHKVESEKSEKARLMRELSDLRLE